MSTTHTPGPWTFLDRLKYDQDEMHRYCIRQRGGTNEIIATTVKEYPSVDDLSNARLMAAAPDLIQVLMKLQPKARKGSRLSRSDMLAIDSAIRKATA